MPKLTNPKQDFPKWYQEVIDMAGLSENSPVKGCMVIKPYGYALWEQIQSELDRRIKAAGVVNAYFPLFIPESFLRKEASHVEGFAPECAVITHGGGKLLAEPLVVRPTSETIIYDTYSRWIQSHRDLPLLINQWANVVRWEMRTRPFLRTTEFLWQEGHTVHATRDEAAAETDRALKMYQDFEREHLALPVMAGRKSAKETFAGADYTLTTEALARDGKAIQAATSHLLGQTFAKAFGIQFQDEKGQMQFAWQTSWGMSTRIIGTIIVCHGDEHGLRLPPHVAPHQVVIVPIGRDDDWNHVLQEAEMIADSLRKQGVRVHLDLRSHLSPGFKFNEWEVKGVPVRIEIGPKDLAARSALVLRRDTMVKETVSLDEIAEKIPALLENIHESMYAEALNYLTEHTSEASTMEELKKILDEKGGFVRIPWAGDEGDEKKLQEVAKATLRVVDEKPLDQEGTCVITGKKTTQAVYVAQAY